MTEEEFKSESLENTLELIVPVADSRDPPVPKFLEQRKVRGVTLKSPGLGGPLESRSEALQANDREEIEDQQPIDLSLARNFHLDEEREQLTLHRVDVTSQGHPQVGQPVKLQRRRREIFEPLADLQNDLVAVGRLLSHDKVVHLGPIDALQHHLEEHKVLVDGQIVSGSGLRQL